MDAVNKGEGGCTYWRPNRARGRMILSFIVGLSLNLESCEVNVNVKLLVENECGGYGGSPCTRWALYIADTSGT